MILPNYKLEYNNCYLLITNIWRLRHDMEDGSG